MEISGNVVARNGSNEMKTERLCYDHKKRSVFTDMPIVVYCWTGQHSSQVTAYLNMLGYEAKGANDCESALEALKELGVE